MNLSNFSLKAEHSPSIRLKTLKLGHRFLHVVREDLLPGGTKQRASLPYLRDQMKKGVSSFAYASPFAGFAQVALASSAQSLNAKVRLYCEKAPHPSKKVFHEFSRLAESYGAEIRLCDTLQEAEASAEEYSKQNENSLKIPLGFDCPDFKNHLKRALSHEWKRLESKTPILPKRLWVSLGSGTLLKSLRETLPSEVQICAVNVHVLKSSDQRITSAADLPNTVLYSAPEEFKDQAKEIPPFSSNIHYDAKVWRFVGNHAENHDIWWNVAR